MTDRFLLKCSTAVQWANISQNGQILLYLKNILQAGFSPKISLTWNVEHYKILCSLLTLFQNNSTVLYQESLN